jgi:hypothetical protein
VFCAHCQCCYVQGKTKENNRWYLLLGRPQGVGSFSHFHKFCSVLNLFSGIADVTYVHTVTANFSQSSQCICVTTDRLCLNKMSCVSIHASGVFCPPSAVASTSTWLSCQQGGSSLASANVLKVLQMLLAALVPS